MERLTCGDCSCFRPVTILDEKGDVGICLCHGYHLKSGDAICPDFER